MKYLKFIMMLFITYLLSGCGTIKVSDAHRQLIRPGIPSGVAQISYSWKLLVDNNVEIKSIILTHSDETTNISTYSVIDLENGKLLNDHKLKNGNYYLSFKLAEETIDEEQEEKIKIEYIENKTSKSLTFKCNYKPDLLMK